MVLRLAALTATLFAAACSFSAGLSEGLRCGDDQRCPDGQACVEGFCAAGAIDAGDVDATVVDPVTRCGTVDLLRDDFEDGAASSQWWVWADVGAETTEGAGHAIVDIASGSDAYGGLTSATMYDLRDACVSTLVTEAGADATILEVRDHLDGKIQLTRQGDVLYAAVFDTGNDGTREEIAYDADAQRYWRICEDEDAAVWSYSADRVRWTELHREPRPIELEHVRVLISAGGAGRSRFDDVNVDRAGGAGFCAADTLVDEFDGDGLYPIWDRWLDTGCTITEADGNLRLSYDGVGDGDGRSFCGIGSWHRYDLSDSEIAVDAIGAVVAPSFTTYFQAFELGDSESRLEIGHEGDTILFEQWDRSVLSGRAQLTYDPAAHRFWRIRGERGTTVFFDTSIDGVEWVNRLETPAVLDLSRMVILLGAGHYAPVGAPVVFDVPAVNP